MNILINTIDDLETYSDLSIMLATARIKYPIKLNSRDLPTLAYLWLQDFKILYPETDIWNTIEYLETVKSFVRHQIKGLFNIDINL